MLCAIPSGILAWLLLFAGMGYSYFFIYKNLQGLLKEHLQQHAMPFLGAMG
jgi:hypothetical protein